MKLHQSSRHHHQVGHHLVCADEVSERGDHLADARSGLGDKGLIGLFGGVAPMPGIVKGDNLGL
jgi:hypothetical protein